VQVRRSVTSTTAIGRLALAIPLAIALTFAVHTASASAITRKEVLKRGHVWVAKKVPYSQRGYFQGYRRDCSGFVSMSWKLKTSYTTRSIGAVAKRIAKSNLRPGDAVRTPGHVAIFAGWANKSHTRYWALEESQRGKPALKRVKTWRTNATALRYRGIRDAAPVKVAAAPVTPVIPSADTLIPETTPTPLPISAPFN
jgi:hypothetical protein